MFGEDFVLGYWHWLGLAAVLLILELLSGSGFLLWVGMAAVAMTGLTWLFPAMEWTYQVLLFAIAALAFAYIWWSYCRKSKPVSDEPRLNRRAEQYVGREFTLSEAIVNGRGRVKVADTLWRAEGPELPAGHRVRVIGTDGIVLKVESCEDTPDNAL